MNLEALKLYCDVVRWRSFSRRAKAQQLSQAAASHSIAQLEHQLGAKLIDRSKRPLAVTSEGRAYYDGVRALLTQYANLEARVRSLKPTVEGVVRVAAIYSIGLYDLNAYTQRFMSQFPQAK